MKETSQEPNCPHIPQVICPECKEADGLNWQFKPDDEADLCATIVHSGDALSYICPSCGHTYELDELEP